MKLEEIEWSAKINNRKYGSSFIINLSKAKNDEINEICNALCLQMVESLQTIINGKTDTDEKIDRLLKKYDKIVKGKGIK